MEVRVREPPPVVSMVGGKREGGENKENGAKVGGRWRAAKTGGALLPRTE